MNQNKDFMKSKINSLIYLYYKDYYLYQLGLKDYEDRIRYRLSEEQRVNTYLKDLQKLAHFRFKIDDKVLIVGAGTGSEFLAFFKKKCNTYCIEPNEKALEIIRLKSLLTGISQNKAIKAYAEELPFNDNYFDYVFCWAVLEHVQNVKRSIDEMVRVSKKCGRIIIVTPDYALFSLWEPHYKTYLPLCLPRGLIKLVLKLKNKPLDFIDTIQFITATQLKKIFLKKEVSIVQFSILDSSMQLNSNRGKISYLGRNFFSNLFGTKNQLWIVEKN